MAWTKEQHAAAYAAKKTNPVWYKEHKAKSLAAYYRRKEKAAETSKVYHQKNKEKRSKAAIDWQKKNKEKVALTKERQVAKMYGLTAVELRNVRKATVCEICNTAFTNTKTKHVDHCHKTGEYRGMLCHHCNLGLGRFKDDVRVLEAAAAYLRKHMKP